MLDCVPARPTSFLKLVKHGGLLRREVASVARAAGIGLYGGCLRSSIGAAAHLQGRRTARSCLGLRHFGPDLTGDLVTNRYTSPISTFTCHRPRSA
jgi:hypothetical protein